MKVYFKPAILSLIGTFSQYIYILPDNTCTTKLWYVSWVSGCQRIGRRTIHLSVDLLRVGDAHLNVDVLGKEMLYS